MVRTDFVRCTMAVFVIFHENKIISEACKNSLFRWLLKWGALYRIYEKQKNFRLTFTFSLSGCLPLEGDFRQLLRKRKYFVSMKKFVCLYDLKGWYCGNKTQSINYRTKKNAPLEEHEWVMYPDPSIPTIVPAALFQRSKPVSNRGGFWPVGQIKNEWYREFSLSPSEYPWEMENRVVLRWRWWSQACGCCSAACFIPYSSIPEAFPNPWAPRKSGIIWNCLRRETWRQEIFWWNETCGWWPMWWKTDDAREDFLWRTDGSLVSVCGNRTAKIYWKAMLN